ncbi:MAG: hypothetical protein EOO01_22250 [Chitinophagaceae bacterium]|nr:MAG: hypothetical protein EOO01_22250 [Chitinophagaceae bacterium]
MFDDDFTKNLSAISADPQLPYQYATEVARQHQKKSRHYHSLTHLQSIWAQLQPVKDQIQDWPVVLFAIAYHDFEYNVLKNDNEERSAAMALKRLKSLKLTSEQVNRCSLHILATKGHSISSDNDTNLFTDADLSILGADPTIYLSYTQSIRKEYRYYPDLLYKPGRKKVLNIFLDMPRIYKTDHFFDLYEKRARANLANEMSLLALARHFILCLSPQYKFKPV